MPVYGNPGVIQAPYQVRDKPQPESSLLRFFWTPAPALDSDPGFAGVTVFGIQLPLS
jgi:hypothetical protein